MPRAHPSRAAVAVPQPLPGGARRPIRPPDGDGVAHAWVRLAANVYAPRTARDRVVRWLIGWGVRDGAVLDLVRGSVGELVTYAVRTAGATAVVEVAVRHGQGWARIAVSDAASCAPAVFLGPTGDDTTRAPGVTPAPGQLGLYVVRRLVEEAGGRVGVEDRADGHRDLLAWVPAGAVE
ncbi:ATP-binding protein [Embleya sp. NPDC127516]|uniref:ATP-binding protein n=1 Tax=Embleya sp. NPDC127516 TaxID=3363990 RepID=UPI0037F59ED3